MGVQKDLGTFPLNDTAQLVVEIYDENDLPVAQADITAVQFVIKKPDETTVTSAGTITADGTGRLNFTDTDQVGEYVAQGRFTLDSGAVRSSMMFFYVEDPFNPLPPTPFELVGSWVWDRLEDCFDSEEGGPWLRDMTLRYFDQSKIPMFVNEALFEINIAPPHSSNAVLDDFTHLDANGQVPASFPLLGQGALVNTIMHLMRSYVEQPQVTGAQVVYEDRRDYLQRWGTILQIEKEKYARWLALYKCDALGFGQSALLVASKAGRLYGPNMRARNVGRGRFGY